MRKICLLLLLLFVFPNLALAEGVIIEERAVLENDSSENASIPLDQLTNEQLFQNLVNTVQPFVTKVSILVGGIFGIYFLLLIVRIYYERKKVRVLMDIRYDLDQQNRKYMLPTSRARRTIPEKIIDYLISKLKNIRTISMPKTRKRKER